MTLEELKTKLDDANYIYDDTLATILCVALQLGRPLLIEGAAGVGKTEIAKVMAAALGRDLIRLQCYEGLDESKALYEWNYQKQLLAIQIGKGETDKDALTKSLFSDEYMLARPLLESIRSEKPVVLLIDEIDKADEEFEAFLLELLSEMQVSIPEAGTIKAKSIPFVVLTSNRARPLSEALRRRCAYIYISYPDIEKELKIIRAKVPYVDEQLAVQVAKAVKKLRDCESILKKPSIAESLDWAAALEALGIRELTPEEIRRTMGFVLKNNEDFETANELFENGIEDENCECGCGGEHDHTAGHACAHGHSHGDGSGHACAHGHSHGDGNAAHSHSHGDGNAAHNHSGAGNPASGRPNERGNSNYPNGYVPLNVSRMTKVD